MKIITSGDAIRSAVYRLLDPNPDIALALQKRMAFRDVAAFTTFPFLAIGHSREQAQPHARTEEHIVTVHLWLKPGEDAVARDLMRSIRCTLDRGHLRVPGARVLRFRLERSGLRPAPELEALHATMRYRLRLSRLRGAATGAALVRHQDGTNVA